MFYLLSDVYMRDNVQAHQGQVTSLRVSASVTESRDSLGSYDRLISFGTDCTVRIWQLIHREIFHVSIQQMALVKLLQPPRDLAMAGNTLCIPMADNNVIMCRLGFSNLTCITPCSRKPLFRLHCYYALFPFAMNRQSTPTVLSIIILQRYVY